MARSNATRRVTLTWGDRVGFLNRVSQSTSTWRPVGGLLAARGLVSDKQTFDPGIEPVHLVVVDLRALFRRVMHRILLRNHDGGSTQLPAGVAWVPGRNGHPVDGQGSGG